MRKVLIGVVVVLVLLAGGVVYAVMNVNALLEENRDRLSRLASDAAGRSVRFEKAEVAYSGGLAIRIEGLQIAEDPRFGKSDFLALDTAFVDVDLWPALQRRLAVSGVRLERPTIHVIQTAKGFNFSSLGGSTEAADAPSAPPPPDEGGDVAIAIAAFEIREGTVLYEDRSADPPRALTIENFESSGTDLSLENAVDIRFSGSVRPTKGDASLTSRLEGRIQIEDLASGEGKLVLSSPKFHPALLGIELEEGDTAERLEQVEFDLGLPANADSVGYPIALRAGSGRLGGFDIENLDAKLRYRGATAEVERLVVGVADGKVDLKGEMTFGETGRSPFKLDTRLEALEVDPLASVLLGLPRGYVSGRIGGDVNLSGDSLDWETLKRSLAGRIQLGIGEGALENVNLLNRFVGRLAADPGLGQLAAASIRDVAPSALEGDRTPFENVNLALAVANGALNAEALELKTGDFLISGLGKLGLDGSVSANGTIRFSETLSRKILAKADRLAPLLGSGDRVELPLRLGGNVSSPTLAPDLTALAAKARANAAGELKGEAGRQLSEALFGKKKPAGEGEPKQPAEADRDAAEALIGKGLDRLFGK